jgi:hypothetical protein
MILILILLLFDPMLRFEFPLRRLPFGKATHTWFAARPDPADAWGFAIYYQAKSTDEMPGFKREQKHTKFISLAGTEDDIFDQIGKNTKPKIKQALAEGGLRFAVIEQADEVRDLYNEFARGKGRPPLEERTFRAYWPKMVATKISLDADPLVMHAFLVDEGLHRANHLYSASLFRSTDDPDRRARIGRANRALHYLNMLNFKDRGITTYDLGGYALGTQDPELQQVNEFKDSFGGQLVEESNYVSLPLHWARKFSGLLRGKKQE